MSERQRDGRLIPVWSNPGLTQEQKERIEAAFSEVRDFSPDDHKLIPGQSVWGDNKPDGLAYVVRGSVRQVMRRMAPGCHSESALDPEVVNVLGEDCFLGLDQIVRRTRAMDGMPDRTATEHIAYYANPCRHFDVGTVQVRLLWGSDLDALLQDQDIARWFAHLSLADPVICPTLAHEPTVNERRLLHDLTMEHPILRVLGAPSRNALLQCAAHLDSHLPTQTRWRSAGEPATDLHMLVHGHAELVLPETADSIARVVALLSPGDLIDAEYVVQAEELMPSSQRHARQPIRRLDVYLSHDARLLSWDRQAFRSIIQRSPPAWQRLVTFARPEVVDTMEERATVTCVVPDKDGWGDDDDPLAFTIGTALQRVGRGRVVLVDLSDGQRTAWLLGRDSSDFEGQDRANWSGVIVGDEARGMPDHQVMLHGDAVRRPGEGRLLVVKPTRVREMVDLVDILRSEADVTDVIVYIPPTELEHAPPAKRNNPAALDSWYSSCLAMHCLDGLRVLPFTTLWLCNNPDGTYVLTDETPDRLIRVDRLTSTFVRAAREQTERFIKDVTHTESADRPGNLVDGSMVVPLGSEPFEYCLRQMLTSEPSLPGRYNAFAEACARAGRMIGRTTIGLALGGGGVWGSSHIAVIEALHDVGIPVDYVSGTSFGALVGGLYAAGGTPALNRFLELCTLEPGAIGKMLPGSVRAGLREALPAPIRTLRNESRAAHNPVAAALRHAALGRPQELDALVERVLDETNGGWVPKTHHARGLARSLHETHVPFLAVASSLTTHTEYAPRNLRLGMAVRMASGLPPVFPGLWLKGAKLIDGAALANVPVEALKTRGADFVIAVNVVGVGKVKRRADRTPHVGTMAERVQDVIKTGWLTLWKAGTAQAERHADVLIDVRIEGVGLASTWRAQDIVDGLGESMETQGVGTQIMSRYRGGAPTGDGGPLRIPLFFSG